VSGLPFLVLELYSSINFPIEFHVHLRVLFVSSCLYLCLARSEIRLPLLHQPTLDQTSATRPSPSKHLAIISRPPSRMSPAGYTSPNALTAAARELPPLKLLAQEPGDSNPRQIPRPVLTQVANWNPYGAYNPPNVQTARRDISLPRHPFSSPWFSPP
jgi:hypothetical protein